MHSVHSLLLLSFRQRLVRFSKRTGSMPQCWLIIAQLTWWPVAYDSHESIPNCHNTSWLSSVHRVSIFQSTKWCVISLYSRSTTHTVQTCSAVAKIAGKRVSQSWSCSGNLAVRLVAIGNQSCSDDHMYDQSYYLVVMEPLQMCLPIWHPNRQILKEQ